MRGISDWQKFEGPTFELHTIVFNNGALIVSIVHFCVVGEFVVAQDKVCINTSNNENSMIEMALTKFVLYECPTFTDQLVEGFFLR
jgi:hypothetical protein